MVGVVGSSPIAPTSCFRFAATHRFSERHGYDTANAQGTLVGNASSHVVCVRKSAARPHFFVSGVRHAQDHAARRRRQGLRRARFRRRSRRRDRPGSRQGRTGRKGRRQARRHLAPDRSRCGVGDRHRQGRRRAGGAAPFDRAPARVRREGTLSRGAGDDRSRDRGRLLLRLLVPAARSRPRTSPPSRRRWPSSRRRTSPSCAR